MRKRVLTSSGKEGDAKPAQRGLDVEQIATVEVTSEHPDFPIDAVFGSDGGPGWRASEKGQQQIRIIFDEPISLKRIELRFHEAEVERSQEFSLRWSSFAGGASREILRQQWNFSPAGSTTEVEDISVDLQSVAVLELAIEPDKSGRSAFATLSSWRLS